VAAADVAAADVAAADVVSAAVDVDVDVNVAGFVLLDAPAACTVGWMAGGVVSRTPPGFDMNPSTPSRSHYLELV
jgi:hypothetical protein